MVARAAAVLKNVSQHVVNRRLLVRVTGMCTRTSASVLTLSRLVATVAVHRSHAVHRQAVVMAMAAATLTHAAVIRQPAVQVAETETETDVAMVPALQTQAAVLQWPVTKVVATIAVL